MVAREWIDARSGDWGQSNNQQATRRLERDAFPWTGQTEVHELEPPEVLQMLRRIEGRGAIETAHRLKLNSTIAVITLSAFGDVPDAVAAMRLGAVDCVEKPFDPEQLLARTLAVLNNKQDADLACRNLAKRVALIEALIPREKQARSERSAVNDAISSSGLLQIAFFAACARLMGDTKMQRALAHAAMATHSVAPDRSERSDSFGRHGHGRISGYGVTRSQI